jgi:diacylglycerol kinase (ATP)
MMSSIDNKKWKTQGFTHFKNAFFWSLEGLAAAFKHEAAFRHELAVILALSPIALWLSHSLLDFVLLIGVLVLVLVIELLNSAIEALADVQTTAFNPGIKLAKDYGSAATMLTMVLAGATWLAMLLTRLQDAAA